MERFSTDDKNFGEFPKVKNLVRLIRGISAPEVCLNFSAFFIFTQNFYFSRFEF